MTNEELRIEIGKKLGMSWWSIHPKEAFREGAHWCNTSDECMLPDDEGDCAMFGKYEDNGRFIAVKDYPNNIAAAWELFDEMPVYKSLERRRDDGREKRAVWECSVNGVNETILADTAPVAICLAWLAWKETK